MRSSNSRISIRLLRVIAAAALALACVAVPALAFAEGGAVVNAQTSKELSGVDGISWTQIGTCQWGINSSGCLIIRPIGYVEGSTNPGELPTNTSSTTEFWPWLDTLTIGNIKSIEVQGYITPGENISHMFEGCANATSISISSNFNTSSVTNMNSMFKGCTNAATINVSGFNTANVTDMGNMFYGCEKVDGLNVSGFNTAKVTQMVCMFRDCKSLKSLNVTGFSTSLINDMQGLFMGCSSLTSLDVSHFDTTNVQQMNAMFANCSALTSLDVTKFSTSKVKGMSQMFLGCAELTSLDVSNFETLNVTSMKQMFYGCAKLGSLNLSKFNTNAVTDMGGMFGECSSLTKLDLTYLGTSNVKDMNSMFSGCSGLTKLDVTMLDTSKVTDMHDMFSGCSGLTSLKINGTDTSFVTSAVTSMKQMFANCSKLTTLDITNFETALVTSMNAMFYGCTALQSLNYNFSKFNTSNVTDMYAMFANCENLSEITVSGFNTSKVQSMEFMFYNCKKVGALSVSNFNTAQVTNVKNMFNYCSSLTSLNLSSFDLTNVTSENAKGFLYNCAGLTSLTLRPGFTLEDTTLGGKSWKDDSKIYQYASDMFAANALKTGSDSITYSAAVPAAGYTQLGTCEWKIDSQGCLTIRPVGYVEGSQLVGVLPTNQSVDSSIWPWYSKDVRTTVKSVVFQGNVKASASISNMFRECENLTNVSLANLDTTGVTDMEAMFYGCKSLTDVAFGSVTTGSVTTMKDLFSGCEKLSSVNLSTFNTSNVKSMYGMFSGCAALTALDVSSFDTSNVTNLNSMFYGCAALTALNLDNFSTANVTDMYGLFANCSKLASLTLDTTTGTAKFDTSKVNTMYGMFANCEALTAIDVSGFNTSSVANMKAMFGGCKALLGLDLTNFDFSKVTEKENMLAGLTALDALTLKPGQNIADMGLKGTPWKNDSGTVYLATANMIEANAAATGTDAITYTPLPVLEDWTVTGTCEWHIDENGCLTIRPFGYTKDATLVGTLPSNDDPQKIVWGWCFDDKKASVKSVVFQGNVKASAGLSNMFINCTNLESVSFENFNTSATTDMQNLFYGCAKLTTVDFGSMSTANVTTMKNMFNGCAALATIDVSSFDTSKVADMNSMFRECVELTSLNLDSFSTANVTDMYGMFYNCAKLATLILDTETGTAKFDTSNVATMEGMFANCAALASIDVSAFNTTNVKSMTAMFGGCATLPSLNLSSFDFSNVTSKTSMLAGLTALDDLTLKAGQNIADMGLKGTPWKNDSGTVYLSTSTMIEANAAATGTAAITYTPLPVLEDWTVTGTCEWHIDENGCLTIRPFGYTKDATLVGTLPSNDDPQKIVWGWCFDDKKASVKSVVFQGNVKASAGLSNMFIGCTNLESVAFGSFDTSATTDMQAMFNGCAKLTSVDFGSMSTANVTTMKNMFNGCAALATIDLSSFDTANVASMNAMFWGCENLTSLNLDSFSTASVTDMYGMFYGCTKLATLTLDTETGTAKFDTSKVTTMEGMFANCEALTAIDVSGFNTSLVTTMRAMFYQCKKLVSLNLSSFNMAVVSNKEGMLSSLSSLSTITLKPGLDLQGAGLRDVPWKDGSENSFASTTEMLTANAALIGSDPVVYTAQKGNIANATADAKNMSQVYTGEPLSPTVTLTLDEQTLVEGTDYDLYYNSSTTAPYKRGNYTLSAKGKNGLIGTLTIGTFSITKDNYDMSGVIFADTTVAEDGQPHSIIATNLPEGVTATYEGNGQTERGVYTITASFTGDEEIYNPIDNKTATLTIVTPNRADFSLSGISNPGNTIYIDGVPIQMTTEGSTSYVKLGNANAKVATLYVYNKEDSNPHNVYPTHMYVWFLSCTEGQEYTVTRQSGFDDVLQYAGTSIRLTGKKGIRVITGVPTAVKNALTSSSGYLGWRLEEYGTVTQYDDVLKAGGYKDVDFTINGVKSAYAYNKIKNVDPVYKRDSNVIKYTNMLVDFGYAECDRDLALRPYMKLTNIATSEQIIIYGGTIRRSIGFVAYQNRNKYDESTEAGKFIWDIIRNVDQSKF